MSKSAWRFTLLLSVLLIISAAISIGYYLRPEFFSSHLATTNLKVEKAKVSELYLSFEADSNPQLIASKCYSSDRRESTMRRSDMKLGGKLGTCRQSGTKWIFEGKKGSFTLLSITEVTDRESIETYRKMRKDLKWFLPKLTVVNLFINRLFVGEYLKLDLTKFDHAEFWEVEGDQIYTFNASLQESNTLFFQALNRPLRKIVDLSLANQNKIFAVNRQGEAYALPLPHSLHIFNPGLTAKKVSLDKLFPSQGIRP